MHVSRVNCDLRPGNNYQRMATRSYTILSHYTPPSRNEIASSSAGEEFEGDEQEQEKIWQTGPLYKSRSADSDAYVSHRAAHPPRFVPAALSHETLPFPRQPATAPRSEKSPAGTEKAALGGWYNSLQTTMGPKVLTPSEPAVFVGALVSAAHSHSPARPEPTYSKKRGRSQDWFIHNALSTSRSTSRQSSAATSTASSSSSLAEILSRAPPPLPGSFDPKFLPPLRTKLGPGNRGYALLSQQGWKEGEGLGSWRTWTEGRPYQAERSGAIMESDSVQKVSGSTNAAVDEEPIGVVLDTSVKIPQIVDLTLSDDDDFIDKSSEDFPSPSLLPKPLAASIEDALKGSDPSRSILLAPLKTYLKSDRLGIGAHRRILSSSTSSSPRHGESRRHAQPTTLRGSFSHAKQKPLTDTAQAMHDIRDREQRRREEKHRALMIRLKGGRRGSKGFAAVKREEERRRRDFLAYMKS